MKIATTIGFRCPVCKELCTAFDEVIFTEDYHIVVNWRHCKRHLTSGEVNALELFPTKDGKSN